jgi:hypothetical protein
MMKKKKNTVRVRYTPHHGKEAFLHEMLAQEIKKSRIDCQALSVDSHPIEGKPYTARCLLAL